MKLTIKQLYEISKEADIAVLGKDGLPFNSVTSITPNEKGETYFFRHEEGKLCYPNTNGPGEPWLDFHKFYEICIPSICRNDMVAGECEVMHIDDIYFIGIDLYNEDLEKLIYT